MKHFFDKIITIKPWVMFLSMIVLSVFPDGIIKSLLFVIAFSLFTFWTLGVGEKLHSKLKDKSILNLKRFKIQIAFVVIYFLVAVFFGGYKITNENIHEYGVVAYVIIPLHLVIMFFMIHTIYFLSKSIVVLRNQKEGYGWYMLGFWFFPIGIWIIQPRVIELLEE
ncbi:hypothetical protein [Tenacibaculum crassostreae]|uniref:hypothetical protein n=1 Tax=Tenacibaculum crassostreae TaxID=502683 RepID=UPI00389403A7